MKISPLAVVDPKAQIGPDVEIGPFCVIGPDVTIGPGCRLTNNVTVMGRTTIGKDNVFFPNTVIGAPPQDRKYKGALTCVEIGDANQFREASTLHAGTEKGGGVTRLGSNCLVMINAHVGHDAQVGSNVILSNNVMIAGHVVIGDYVVASGGAAFHHFVTVGEYAFLGGYARIHHDVPPFTIVDGADEVRGINRVGLRRAGFAEADVETLEDAIRNLYYGDKPFTQALLELESLNGENRHIRRLVEFIRQRDQGIHGRYLETLRRKHK